MCRRAAVHAQAEGLACIALALRPLSALPLATHAPAGAGEAGTGIGELIAICLEHHHGMSREEGRRHCLFMDSKGLVCASRTDLQHHKRPFAHDVPPCATLLEAVRRLHPTVLIGVSTIAGAFDAEVLQVRRRGRGRVALGERLRQYRSLLAGLS